VGPTPADGDGDARDCAGCHTDETHLKTMVEVQQAPPADTCDG